MLDKLAFPQLVHLRLHTFLFLLTITFGAPAHAVLLEMNSSFLQNNYGVFSLLKAQQLEGELNDKVFTALGAEIEFAAPTGGTVAVDDLAFEGPGLTVIGGSGFIIRFDSPVDSVRVRFGNAKDDDARQLRVFDFAADYTRGPAPGSQSVNGNVVAHPLGEFDNIEGIVPTGLDNTGMDPTQYLDLELTGDIHALHANTNKFLTSVLQIEFEAGGPTTVPLPASLWLFLAGGFALVFQRSLGARSIRKIKSRKMPSASSWESRSRPASLDSEKPSC
ncbi:Uncharacterised protein [Halioglobus japonicus]|nr:Uncharacterised protein [Halioglobus japonicus]